MKLFLLFSLFFVSSCAHIGSSGRYVKRGNVWVFEKTSVGFGKFFGGGASIDDSPFDFKDSGRFLWPVPSSRKISSHFGARRGRHHDGIDIPATTGANVIASDKGIVLFSGWMRGYGNIVVLKHDGAYHTIYGHNSKLIVKKGASVNRGQVIALVGSTGRSTGPHAHFEIRKNNKIRNPSMYFDFLKPKNLAKK